MGISTILSSVSATLAQQSTPVSVRSAAPSAPASNSAPVSSASQASFTSPSQSVVQSSSLISASSSFAQLGSLLEVAQSGTQQISSILQQLVALANQVPQTTDLSGIESEFSQLIAQIGETASCSRFGGNSLLSGNYSATPDASSTSDSNTGQQLSLPDLTVQGLFGSNTPSVSTPADALNALTTLAAAQNTVDGTSADITNVLGQLSFAAASVNTVLANNDAATSTLSDEDLQDGTSNDGSPSLLGNASTAAQTQSGNLSASLLDLLQE